MTILEVVLLALVIILLDIEISEIFNWVSTVDKSLF